MTTNATVGERLKAERERLGLQRVDVARETKIYIHQLLALEFGQFDELPDEDALEDAVRAYAGHLGLDGEAMVADLRRERGLPERPPRVLAVPVPMPRRSVRIALALALAALLPAVVAIWWLRRETPPLPVPRSETAPPAEAAPESADAPEPVAAAEPGATLSVPEHGVGRAVTDHRLVGASDRFAVGREVWFWTSVVGGSRGDVVRHVWIHGEREVQVVPLVLGGGRWRTQSSRRLSAGSEGSWTVEVRDAAGNTLARDRFTCGP